MAASRYFRALTLDPDGTLRSTRGEMKSPGRGKPMHEFATKEDLIAAAAAKTAAALNYAIGARGTATLMCSGGSTPGPVYEALAMADLDGRRLHVGLADERWVDPDSEASNARLVRRTLLKGSISQALFHPLGNGAGKLLVSAEVEQSYKNALPADMIILGMGADGHSLSWFPGAEGLEGAMDQDNANAVAPIIAIQSDVTGTNTERLTLTASAVSSARAALLLITGDAKREVWNNGSDDMPVHALPKLLGDRLTVFWAP